jgi:hypothetical protein
MKVGDYVRADKGLIGKVIKKEEYDTHTILEYEGQYCKRVLSTTGTDSEIIKSSPNIIDLIEVGDYVNGKLVEDIFNRTNYADKSIKLKGSGDYWYNEHIKSIVTKEQFKSIEYEVK